MLVLRRGAHAPCATSSSARARGSARAASRAARTRPIPTRASTCLFCQKARASLIDEDGASARNASSWRARSSSRRRRGCRRRASSSAETLPGPARRGILARGLGRRARRLRAYLAVERNYSPRTVEVYLRDVARAARAPARQARQGCAARAAVGDRRAQPARRAVRHERRRRRSVASCRACARSAGSSSSAA